MNILICPHFITILSFFNEISKELYFMKDNDRLYNFRTEFERHSYRINWIHVVCLLVKGCRCQAVIIWSSSASCTLEYSSWQLMLSEWKWILKAGRDKDEHTYSFACLWETWSPQFHAPLLSWRMWLPLQ